MAANILSFSPASETIPDLFFERTLAPITRMRTWKRQRTAALKALTVVSGLNIYLDVVLDLQPRGRITAYTVVGLYIQYAIHWSGDAFLLTFYGDGWVSSVHGSVAGFTCSICGSRTDTLAVYPLTGLMCCCREAAKR